jgi:hypothetical protein
MAALALTGLGSVMGLGGLAGLGAGGLGALSSMATAVSVLGAVGRGVSGLMQGNAEARDSEIQAGQVAVQTAQRQSEMQKELVQIMGGNDVAFAAAGVDVSQGIAANARRDVSKEAARAQKIAGDDGAFRRSMLRLRARNQRRAGVGKLASGLLGAFGAGIDGRIDLVNRGAA